MLAEMDRHDPREELFWSKHGHVVCATHLPGQTAAESQTEGWRPIPPDVQRHGLAYQCEKCGSDRSPIRHVKRDAETAGEQ